jgi:hypothetical protein
MERPARFGHGSLEGHHDGGGGIPLQELIPRKGMPLPEDLNYAGDPSRRWQSMADEATDCALQRLERPLLEDRLAVILFLFGSMIFAYTFLNAPV